MSEMFSIFAVSGDRHYILMKVFLHCPCQKCGNFDESKDVGQHSFIHLDYAVRGYCILCFLISIWVWSIGYVYFDSG